MKEIQEHTETYLKIQEYTEIDLHIQEYSETSVDPCIKCTKRSFIERSVIERSVFECEVLTLFFEFFFELSFDYPLGAGEHFRAFSTSGGFGASMFEHFSTPGGFGASNLEDFRRLEASERAFSSILDVWTLRSEDFRGFSRRAGEPRPQNR